MHKSKKSLKSWHGGILTILFTITMLFYVSFRIERLISRRDYNVKSGVLYNEDDTDSIIYAVQDKLKIKVTVLDPHFDNENS